MKRTTLSLVTAFSALLAFASPALAQPTAAPESTTATASTDDAKATTPPADVNWLKGRPVTIQYFRQLDANAFGEL